MTMETSDHVFPHPTKFLYTDTLSFYIYLWFCAGDSNLCLYGISFLTSKMWHKTYLMWDQRANISVKIELNIPQIASQGL